MKKETTADRLRTIIKARDLHQVDILALAAPYCKKYNVKMNKSDLSQYVNGKVEPRQEKLTVLGLALDVSEAWLMGYDVPMERDSNRKASATESPKTDARLNKIIEQYHGMNMDGQIELAKYADYISTKPEYSGTSAQSRTILVAARGGGVQHIYDENADTLEHDISQIPQTDEDF